MIITNHQKWGGQIDSNKINTGIHAKTKGTQSSHGSAQISHQPQPRFRSNPVSHHTGHCKCYIFETDSRNFKNSNLPTENIAITIKVDAKYGITDRVFLSSSWSRVFEANLAILICLKRSSTSWICSIRFRKASSHAPPLVCLNIT